MKSIFVERFHFSDARKIEFMFFDQFEGKNIKLVFFLVFFRLQNIEIHGFHFLKTLQSKNLKNKTSSVKRCDTRIIRDRF